MLVLYVLFPSLPCLVLHVLCPSFLPLLNQTGSWVGGGHPRLRVTLAPGNPNIVHRYLPPTQSWLWSEVSESEVKSDAFLVHFFSQNYILYIIYMPITLYKLKSVQQLFYGINILDKLEGCNHKNQNHNKYVDFEFCIQKYRILCT